MLAAGGELRIGKSNREGLQQHLPNRIGIGDIGGGHAFAHDDTDADSAYHSSSWSTEGAGFLDRIKQGQRQEHDIGLFSSHQLFLKGTNHRKIKSNVVAGRVLELRSERLQNPLCAPAAHDKQVGSLRVYYEPERNGGDTGLKDFARAKAVPQRRMLIHDRSHLSSLGAV